MATTASTASRTPQLLTEELRAKTKGLHGKLDRLVQLGLFTVLDYRIYRQLLLGFYYVYKTFEEEYENHLKKVSQIHPWVLHAYAPELRRTEAFEADLAYFYGEDWKQNVSPSKSLQQYMEHIRDIGKHHPEKLVAFPATMYLGIFFGGQIVRSKIVKATSFFPSPPNKKLGGEHDGGIAIFTFREKAPPSSSSPSSLGNVTISSNNYNDNQKGKKKDPIKLRNELKTQLNSIPGLDDTSEKAIKERQAIVDEAREIFARNMDLITEVDGVSKVWTRWIIRFFLYLAIAVALYQFLTKESSFGNPLHL
ncbi:hypothetical protein BX616_005390 [Lobosporangium transversale]|uniref:Heme oxygenase-like protein n=1 Tax=Lobosporangium transversale TaxID=64571 RepID=A0A1Y2G8B6_9FUNG|nr:hypothetical protein BCR41DRAFT_363150 [Lobosporangium transversale]KAF9897540.1 hypothetical protein BX616_005390 [Lobosporangium transversale]ORZ04074.1 hypothetical protein BCR41DRAFT_363150 [Lobosporangium transversale]|eukprot:XP_021876351.1 hypothetical protein BCR41DRAFT_363150 [Lobosporangium transversale]